MIMPMQKIAAHYVFPVVTPPLRQGIVTVDDEGYILEVTGAGSSFREETGMVFYSGVLVPSFYFSREEGGVKEYFPEALRQEGSREYFERVLKEITWDRAQALGLTQRGSLERGKRPGILLISPFDFERWWPAEEARITKIV